MTKQETFDRVVQHLRQQAAKAEDSNGGCMYRTPDGKRCAVGALIPDELYRPAFEGFRIGGENPVTALMEHLGHSLPLLRDLQRLHDNGDVREWETELECVAKKHRLRYTPP